MKTFKEIKGKKKIVFTFGRFQPPTAGHQKVIEKVLAIAQKEKAEARIYISQSQDAKKNPLTTKQKLKYLKLGIPHAADYIVFDAKAKNPFDAVKCLENEGYTDIILVVGEDRVKKFEDIKKYINHPDKSKSYEIDSFKIVCAGERTQDEKNIAGLSSSKLREAAKNNDFKTFYGGVPSHLSERFSKEMFEAVKKGLSPITINLKDSLNLPRNKMPQIKHEDIQDFILDLEKNGISISTKQLAIKDLKPTQKEVNPSKIIKKKEEINDGSLNIKTFIVSLDNYILDGHHQLFAMRDINMDIKVSAYVVGLKMEDLLKYASEYPKVYYKEIDE
jgi:nicotinic acid mononucleotide adenylyltransferase